MKSVNEVLAAAAADPKGPAGAVRRVARAASAGNVYVARDLADLMVDTLVAERSAQPDYALVVAVRDMLRSPTSRANGTGWRHGDLAKLADTFERYLLEERPGA